MGISCALFCFSLRLLCISSLKWYFLLFIRPSKLHTRLRFIRERVELKEGSFQLQGKLLHSVVGGMDDLRVENPLGVKSTFECVKLKRMEAA